MGIELGRQRIVYIAVAFVLSCIVILNFRFLTSGGGGGGANTPATPTTRVGGGANSGSSERIAVLVTPSDVPAAGDASAMAAADNQRWPSAIFTVIRLPRSPSAAATTTT